MNYCPARYNGCPQHTCLCQYYGGLNGETHQHQCICGYEWGEEQ